MVHDTPSHGSDHLCLIWKESIHNCRWYRADTACGTDGRTDGRTDGQTDRRTDGRSETSIHPQQLRCAGGINMFNRSQRNFVVIGRVCFKPDHFKFWSNFKFDRNMVSGTVPGHHSNHWRVVEILPLGLDPFNLQSIPQQLLTQGARALAAMPMTSLYLNIPALTSE